MDFAKRQLLKYGWEEGKGLGKNESGVTEPIKPKLKFDTTGVGHNSSEQFTYNWWENVYNQAADNIHVTTSENCNINIKSNSEESFEITTKKYSQKYLKNKNNLEYGCFLKTSKLTPSGVVDYENIITMETDEMEQNLKVANLADAELFEICGGRTAHKGARHGLKLSGKLTRIEEQEILLLKKMKKDAQNLETENNSFIPAESGKKKKSKKNKDKEYLYNENEELNYKKNKKSKKRKHSQTETDEEVELQAAEKRTEYYIEKQKKRKLKKIKKIQNKKICKLTSMLENVCVSNQQDNKDDGYEESTKSKVDEDSTESKKKRKKHKKKKRKLNVAKNSDDDGFEECINEVNEKLIFYKEFRKDLQEEKRKGEEKQILKIAEELEQKL